MDPTACYREMKLAMLEGDFETARDYALNLQRWFNQGGFEPEGENGLEVKGHLARVLRITTPGVPPEPEIFSLTCSECDYGDGITTEVEAIEPRFGRLEVGKHTRAEAERRAGVECRSNERRHRPLVIDGRAARRAGRQMPIKPIAVTRFEQAVGRAHDE